jgi:hypothetical protein
LGENCRDGRKEGGSIHVKEVDWACAPLAEFYFRTEFGENRLSTGRTLLEHGDGEAQRFLRNVWWLIADVYDKLLPEDEETTTRFERGEVPAIRSGKRYYERLDSFTLSDLPVILDTFVVLEAELKERERALAEAETEASKIRDRSLAREQYKHEKLGEGW